MGIKHIMCYNMDTNRILGGEEDIVKNRTVIYKDKFSEIYFVKIDKEAKEGRLIHVVAFQGDEEKKETPTLEASPTHPLYTDEV